MGVSHVVFLIYQAKMDALTFVLVVKNQFFSRNRKNRLCVLIVEYNILEALDIVVSLGRVMINIWNDLNSKMWQEILYHLCLLQ